MIKYRYDLPMLNKGVFLTDGGLETTFIFHKNIELPQFAAFTLLKDLNGVELLKEYYQFYIDIAKEYKTGFILESPTWRASSKWADKLGYSKGELKQLNLEAIKLLEKIRDENSKIVMPISACIGPKGDGYILSEKLSAQEAKKYHLEQITTLSQSNVDLITAFTLGYEEEAVGIVNACKEANMPVVIGFTLETDGKLPSGQTLKDVIENVDSLTQNYPSYYMVNCVHPIHFNDILKTDERWKLRIHAIRANASKKSHDELDRMEELDEGNPQELAVFYRKLKRQLKNLNIIGGCCGTDHRHLGMIAREIFD